jgi:hypothetical protein
VKFPHTKALHDDIVGRCIEKSSFGFRAAGGVSILLENGLSACGGSKRDVNHSGKRIENG